MAPRTEELIAGLEGIRREPGSATAAERLLDALAAAEVDDAATLIRLHDALLFLRAHPRSAGILTRVDALLDATHARVERLRAAGADLSPLDEHEVAGIAGTAITMAFTFDAARWLVHRFPGRVTIAWDDVEGTERLGAALPRFLPLLDDEALVDVDVPFRAWIDAARGHATDAAWLIGRFDALPVPPRERAERYEALALPLRWELGDSPLSRTRARRPPSRPFVFEGPFLTRRDVSLGAELSDPAPLPARLLSRREGERFLDLARAVMGVRYRELYAFTHGDPESVWSVRAGRGTEILVNGLLPGRRLPLRAGYGALVVRNGVPVGYGDAFGLLERLDVSFNVFFAFRDGESAWLYARLLRAYRQLLGVTLFAVDPFQIGRGNDEALASGAFWFYRKLGFRSVDPEIEALARREEARLAKDPARRTSAATLRRLSSAGLAFSAGDPDPAWDGFQVRNLGLGVAGAAGRTPLQQVLDRLPRDAAPAALKRRIVAAKREGPEASYLGLLRSSPRLRASLLALGGGRHTG